MFLLNPGRYVVGDPETILKEASLKSLMASGSQFNCLVLPTSLGPIIAPSTEKNGEFATNLGRSLLTRTAHIAFVPYGAAEKLLPSDIFRINLASPSFLFHNANGNIELDGRLIIFCASDASLEN